MKKTTEISALILICLMTFTIADPAFAAETVYLKYDCLPTAGGTSDVDSYRVELDATTGKKFYSLHGRMVLSRITTNLFTDYPNEDSSVDLSGGPDSATNGDTTNDSPFPGAGDFVFPGDEGDDGSITGGGGDEVEDDPYGGIIGGEDAGDNENSGDQSSYDDLVGGGSYTSESVTGSAFEYDDLTGSKYHLEFQSFFRKYQMTIPKFDISNATMNVFDINGTLIDECNCQKMTPQ